MPTGQTFESNGVRITYDDVGEGAPIVLVHGFASSREGNWRESGWYDALTDAGRRVIALDCRGHGESDTPHDPTAYELGEMPRDVVRLLNHLDIETADLMGYSMGGRLSLYLLVEHPERFNAVVLAGIGPRNLGFVEERDRGPTAEAMAADDSAEISDPRARGFREFAERRGNDLDALAAYQRAERPDLEDRLGEIRRPVLVVNGGDDDLGDPAAVAGDIPGAEAAVVPGEDHLTTVGDPHYRELVLEFLEREGL